jgi:hypothetical protein
VLDGSGLEVSVGGVTAIYKDLSDILGRRLPLFMGVVIGLSFLLLLVVFRSVLVPIKAAVMNLLSIGAAYGVNRRCVPVGVAQRADRGRPDRADPVVRADDALRHPLRAVHGLRGVPDLAHA